MASLATGTTPLWERSKENAAPLKRGRNVAQLESALQETDETRVVKERTAERYEALVTPSESKDYAVGESPADDPLINWLGYIKFYQDSFPANTHGQFLLMERCFRALTRFQRYANDVRFIRLCCQYAEKTERPNEIFKYLYQQKIGADTAIFWIAWGFVAEKRQEWKFANDIYTKGIRKRAKPVEKLNKRYREFQRRMARHWLNATQTHEEDDGRDSGNRDVLGALTEDAFRHNDRSSSQPSGASFLSRQGSTGTLQNRPGNMPGQSRASEPNRSNSNQNDGGTFRIFEDGEHSENHPLDDSVLQQDIPYRQLEREQDRKKENTHAAEMWNERGAYAPMYGRGRSSSKPRDAKPPPFAVYVDEECAEQHQKEARQKAESNDMHRRVRDERTFRERDDLCEGESLVRDPLRYVRDPSQLDIDQRARTKHMIPQEQGHEAGTRRKANAGFSTRLLRHTETGEEQCFEEARAIAGYYKLSLPSGNVNHLVGCSPKGEAVENGDSESDDISMDDSELPEKMNDNSQYSHRSIDVTADRSVEYSQNASTASSTVEENGVATFARADPTINTQIAMKELSMMFSSPAVGLNDSTVLNRSGGLGPILNESGISEHAEDTENEAMDKRYQGDKEIGSDGSLKDTQSRPFEIHIDEDELEESAKVSTAPTDSKGFMIYTEDTDKVDQPVSRGPARASFSIFNEGDDSPTKSQDEAVPESAFDDILASRTTSPQVPSSSLISKTEALPARSILHGDHQQESENGDTASLSLFDEAMRILDESDDGTTKHDGDCVNLKDAKRRRLTAAPEEVDTVELFGDISCILPTDETTEFLGTHLAKAQASAIEYDYRHKQDVKCSIRHLAAQSTPFPKNSRSLGKILSTQDLVCELPSHVLPQSLRRQKSSISSGTGIKLGKSSVIVKQELGRGAYGCVFLLEPGAGNSDCPVAVKAQTPVGSLAWEYVILQRLRERFESGPYSTKKKFPFPRPMSFLSLADGAVLTMEAVSTSGLNFIDLVNIHRESRGEPALPEILAFHYVSRMLDVLESLHWFGHILHCDTKADNWVLSTSTLIDGEAIDASGVTLTDFGRAIDLDELAKNHPLECKLKGRASREDMMCVAMRQQLPWSFDIDTYGLCDTAHILLFGCSLEIVKDAKTKRFTPRQSFRRYHQSNLWSLLFDTLLNLEEPSKAAIGSRPGSLRQIRAKFDEYLKERGSEVKAQLKHQAAFLPSKRPGLSPTGRRKS